MAQGGHQRRPKPQRNTASADRAEATRPIRAAARTRGVRFHLSRRTRTGLRTALALMSVVVLALTGYGWLTVGQLQGGLSTSGVTAGAGSDGSVDILLVGKDSRTDAQGNPLPEEVLERLRAGDNEASLTDTLILLHIPRDRSRAVAYSLPRDTYVSIPDGYGEHKINSVFGRGKSQAATELSSQGVSDPAELERKSSEAGRELLVRTAERLTGVGIDHYAEVNLLGFYQLTKAVGGVEVCLNEPVDDPYSGADFAAGRQTISGGDALAFVRQRHGLPRGDLDRVERQQAFLAGLARSMLSSGTLANPAQLNRLFDSLQKSVVLDEGWDVLTFAQQMQGLAGGNIIFDTIPVEDPAYDTPDGEAVKVDPDQIRQVITRTNQGLPAEPRPPEGAEQARVDVLNSTDVSGLASSVLDELEADSIGTVDVGNTEPRRTSRVQYPPGSGELARYVADQLNGLPVRRDGDLSPGEIDVVLADDYDGPGALQFGPRPTLRLDGTSQQAPASPSPAAEEDAITADGVPCVN